MKLLLQGLLLASLVMWAVGCTGSDTAKSGGIDTSRGSIKEPGKKSAVPKSGKGPLEGAPAPPPAPPAPNRGSPGQ